MASGQIVLGGGIAGLSAAYYLSKLSKKSVTLLECTSRLGGWIRSAQSPNGTNFEIGPRTMRLAGAAGLNTLELIEELGLEKDVRPVLHSSPAAKNRMLLVDGYLCSLPNNFSSLFKTIPPFSKPLIFALIKDLRTPRFKLEDDNIYNFVARRFGEEIAYYAVSSLVAGVCAGDAKKISVNLLMGGLFDWEQKYDSVIMGMIKSAFQTKAEANVRKESRLAKRAKKEEWSVWSLRGGLEKLPITLGEVLKQKENVDVLLESPCDGLRFTSSGAEVLTGGKSIAAEHIYCGLPAQAAAQIMPSEHSLLIEELSSIPTVTVGVVNLEYAGNVLPVEGFGFLIPPYQNLPILGVIFDTCCFPQEGKTVLTVMMGGAWFKELFGESPETDHLADIATEEVSKALNISETPTDVRVSILRDCIPQYVVGHSARVEKIRNYIQQHKLPITLIGSSYDGVGVNDVILSSRRGVEANFTTKRDVEAIKT